MRIVLDTNVVMSALLWRSNPHRLLQAIRQHSRMQLYSSPVLLEEFTDVLTRSSATKQLAIIGRLAREVIVDYIEAIELVEPTEMPNVVTRDPDDDHVLACALAAHADVIVSGDKDLLVHKTYRDISIVTPAEALRMIDAK
jgi:putative PIN family toxin of toxin-antitoxin system